MALAHLACREGEAPIVRYLVLRELCGVIRDWGRLLDADLVARADQMAANARARTWAQLDTELNSGAHNVDAVLDWFEERLAEMDRGTS